VLKRIAGGHGVSDFRCDDPAPIKLAQAHPPTHPTKCPKLKNDSNSMTIPSQHRNRVPLVSLRRRGEKSGLKKNHLLIRSGRHNNFLMRGITLRSKRNASEIIVTLYDSPQMVMPRQVQPQKDLRSVFSHEIVSVAYSRV
jgi:hypothetical protein